MYGVVDPAGLRHPELGATGVERREEQPFGVRWRLDLIDRRERGSPGARETCVEVHFGGCPSSSIFRGGGGRPSWRRGQP